MDMAKLRSDEVTREYTAALESYLQCGDEAALHQVYELGRHCLSEGRSILEMISLHHQAMRTVWEVVAPFQRGPDALSKAGEFFTECMSPFEMTHRAFGEANRALRSLNETLESHARLIARELHDQSGQLLAAVHIELDEAARGLPAGSQARLLGVRQLLDQVETQLRDMSHELRPTVLDDLGLVPALESLSNRISKRSNVRVAFKSFSGDRLPGRVEVALYRIVQEALNNVIKHASATSVEIRLRNTGAAVKCSIHDNGIGFDPKALQTDPSRRGLGLLGIRERVQALRGAIQIESVSGQGTKLKIMIPLEG